MRKPRPFRPTDEIAVDYETTGLWADPTARVFSCAWCWVDDGETGIVKEDDPGFHSRVASLWSSGAVLIAHNLQFEIHFTQRHGWRVAPQAQLHDTMILHQYFDNLSPRHSLDYIASRYLGNTQEWDKRDLDVKMAAKIYGTYDRIPIEIMEPYQRADVERAALLYKTLRPLVEESPKQYAEYRNEIDLIFTTVKMEVTGFFLEQKKSRDLIRWMETERDKAIADGNRIAGRDVNLNSEKQLKQLLYHDIGLPLRTSTDKATLAELREINDHPILDAVERVRAYVKGIAMISGYIDAAKHDGAIHPSIKTNHARTGRESCSEPNLQNVSKEVKAGTRYTIPARRCFRARPGYVLILGDYAGIEMRLGVQGTASPRLVRLCEQDFDFHDACAKSFYGARYTAEQDTAIKKALRNRAKNARFAMFYGAGLDKVSATLGLTIEETRAGYDRDRDDWPELYEFMARCTATARRTGFIETFFGRRLRVPAMEPYTATDYCIQGSAAALFKHGQVAVDRALSINYGNERCRVILPVHDELVVEMRRDLLPYLQEVLGLINQGLCNHPQVTVPITVEYAMSTYTWDQKKGIEYAKKKV